MRYQSFSVFGVDFFLIFDLPTSSKVKSDGANRKPVGSTTKCSRGPISYLSPFSRYFESNFWLLTFDLGRANPWGKGHQKGRWKSFYHERVYLVKFINQAARRIGDGFTSVTSCGGARQGLGIIMSLSPHRETNLAMASRRGSLKW